MTGASTKSAADDGETMNAKPSEGSIEGHPVVAAVYDAVNPTGEDSPLHDHRRYLAAGLQGTVLDLGVGTGAMFPYFASVTRERTLDLHGIEPDPHMRRRAKRTADELDLDVAIRPDRAETLSYDDGTFDAVIASIVLCTIPGVERALSEIHRVLTIDGEFRFLEHVHASGLRGDVQDLLAPIWKRASGGCHLNRDTRRAIVESPLEMAEIDEVDGIFPVAPIIRGRAARRY